MQPFDFYLMESELDDFREKIKGKRVGWTKDIHTPTYLIFVWGNSGCVSYKVIDTEARKPKMMRFLVSELPMLAVRGNPDSKQD